MTTASDLIIAAYGKVGMTATTAQVTAGLVELNNMLSQWGADFMVPAVTVEDFDLVIDTVSYTIGDGLTFDTVRPVRVKNCFLRDADDNDFNVEVISSADYNGIMDKDSSGRPTELYYIPTIGADVLYFNRAPDYAYEAHFEFWKNFVEFAATTTTYTLPSEYKKAIIYNLAIDLADNFDRDIPERVFIQAEKSYAAIKKLNMSNRLIPRAQFDFGGGGWNINTDSY